MDQRTLADLLECSVCLEGLDHTSKVLPCQHTFCRRCLDEIILSKQELRCPECRILVDVKVEELPSNILLCRLLEGIKVRPPEAVPENEPALLLATNNQDAAVKTKETSDCPMSKLTTASTSSSAVKTSSRPTTFSIPSTTTLSSAVYVPPASSPRVVSTTSSTGSSSSSAGIRPSQKRLLPSPKLGSRALLSKSSSQNSRLLAPCAKALYSYEGKEIGDVSFKTGDMLLLKKQVDDNWYCGENSSGQNGFFPASYVQVITPLPYCTPQCTALYDFQITDINEEKDCLTFKKNAVLTVMRRVDDNWAEGKLSGRVGIFPISFVQMNDASRTLMKLSGRKAGPSRNAPPTPSGITTPNTTASTAPTTATTSSSSSAMATTMAVPDAPVRNNIFAKLPRNKRHSVAAVTTCSPSTNMSHQRHSMELQLPATTSTVSSTQTFMSSGVGGTSGGTLVVSSSPPPAPSVSRPAQPVTVPNRHSKTAASPPNVGLTKYVSMYAYRPQKVDELELRKADIYYVSEKCQDGWFKGICLRTGRSGVFPGNYVQCVRNQNVVPATTVSKASTPTATAGPPPYAPPILKRKVTLTGSGTGITSSPPNVCLVAASGSSGASCSNQASTKDKKKDNNGVMKVGNFVRWLAGDATRRTSSSKLGNQTTSTSKPSSKHRRTLSADISSSTTAAKHASPPTTTATTKHAVMLSSLSSAIRNVSKPTAADRSAITSSMPCTADRPADAAKAPTMPARVADISKTPATAATSSSAAATKQSSSMPSATVTRVHPEAVIKVRIPSAQGSSTEPSRSEEQPKQPIPLIRERCRCVVPYPPSSEYEIELKVGDIVYVHKRRDDGWLKGTLQRTGKTGLFPASFVESCDHHQIVCTTNE